MTTITDFEAELRGLIVRHLDGDVCPGCLARELFMAAVSMASATGEVCWPRSQQDSGILIDALVQRITRFANDYARGTAILPPGTLLQ